ncbi:hypothetical protein K491DRAFT_255503, partial [Lophiostoma macrostomum CBS 122681]
MGQSSRVKQPVGSLPAFRIVDSESFHLALPTFSNVKMPPELQLSQEKSLEQTTSPACRDLHERFRIWEGTYDDVQDKNKTPKTDRVTKYNAMTIELGSIYKALECYRCPSEDTLSIEILKKSVQIWRLALPLQQTPGKIRETKCAHDETRKKQQDILTRLGLTSSQDT